MWYKFHWSRTTNIYWKPTKGHNSKSYGPLSPTPVYTIHPVIVPVYTNFKLSSFHSSWEICYKNFQEWQNLKTYEGRNSKSYGPLATILQLHFPYLRDQVWYRFQRSRTTNIKVIEQNAFKCFENLSRDIIPRVMNPWPLFQYTLHIQSSSMFIRTF